MRIAPRPGIGNVHVVPTKEAGMLESDQTPVAEPADQGDGQT
jgi:hypothetical protein